MPRGFCDVLERARVQQSEDFISNPDADTTSWCPWASHFHSIKRGAEQDDVEDPTHLKAHTVFPEERDRVMFLSPQHLAQRLAHNKCSRDAVISEEWMDQGVI